MEKRNILFEEKEQEENIWRRKIFVFLRKGSKIFGEGRYISCGGEENWRGKREKISWKRKNCLANRHVALPSSTKNICVKRNIVHLLLSINQLLSKFLVFAKTKKNVKIIQCPHLRHQYSNTLCSPPPTNTPKPTTKHQNTN